MTLLPILRWIQRPTTQGHSCHANYENSHFNICGPLIVGAALSAIMSLVHIFFKGRLTGQVYANFLQNVLPQLIENVPLHVLMNMWMQHDGAPPHYALCSRQVMKEIFDEKWIGWGGPVAWLPRSPNLPSPDYFLWGFVKECVIVVAPITPDDMKERIRRACTEITPQMLAEVRRSFHQRINKCLQVEGHHFEHRL